MAEQHVKNIGQINWTLEEIRSEFDEFSKIYEARPIKENIGGMKLPHLFATWFLLRRENPSFVIESGVWKGQGTWIIEQAVPKAIVHSIDPNTEIREYESPKVNYHTNDFSKIDWDGLISDKLSTVLFFDDHKNALSRFKQGIAKGFSKFIFEDNYPMQHGDCYSFKKAFQHAGFVKKDFSGIRSRLKNFFSNESVEPNSDDAEFLVDNISIYYEFPPLYKPDTTRWGTQWTEENYPTPKSIFKTSEAETKDVLKEEAAYYTWLCFVQAKL